MKTNALRSAAAVTALCLLPGIPLAGAWLAGQPIAQYAEFPPLTRYVPPAPFSWPVFIVLAALILAVVLPFDLRVVRAQRRAPPAPSRPARPFPWWGWAGLAFGGGAWWLAWSRFPWFAPLQPFTFSPLWLAYIVVVNALAYRRRGRCMLTDRPGDLLRLFAASAVFWWFFEYLNRFVQNWYYLGADRLTPLRYFIFATLPFSTVLPAVMGTYEWLDGHEGAGAGLDQFLSIRLRRPRLAAALALLAAVAGLAGIGVWPHLLYPLLWLAPLIVMTAVQALAGRPTLFSPVRDGDWRRLYLLGMSALICGFFWEMWNVLSLAKWAYAVPFVTRFKLFEMPVLGYAGYLPFGLECAAIADWVCRRRPEGGPR